ncbi:TRAP transporter large permease [Arcobacter sp. YIC-80]|uniref:TRAP transporter large permease n=1 Tax=unclassified Arcobacter TaxID=2593671 RepID=UPI00384F2EC4
MEWYIVGIGLLGLLMLFISIGIPIPFALVGASLPFLWTIQDFNTSLMSNQLQLWRTWIDYILLSVPIFIFLGELIAKSNLGEKLYEAFYRGIPVRGTAAYGSIGACAGFGAVCGSSMVGSLTIGGVALKQMLRLGYNKQLSAGILAAGGTLSVLIPPSLILLFYGIVTDTSIGKLFIAGIIPGIILTGMFFSIILIWQKFDDTSIPRKDSIETVGFKFVFFAFLPIIVVGLIIITSIYFGIATPTEAAALGVIATSIFSYFLGGINFKKFLEAILSTMKTMGYLGILLAGASLFGFVIEYYGIPDEITDFMTTLNLSKYEILFAVIIFYIIIGMFLEPVSMTFITLPTIFPLINLVGFDLIWFGIVYTITMEIAVLTPPVGLNLYVIQGISNNEITIFDVIKGVLPFLVALVLMIVLLIFEPTIAMYLTGD